MAAKINALTVKSLPHLKPGRYCDGGNLYLDVAPGGSRAWSFRYTSPVTGRIRQLGLGGAGGAPGLPLAGVTLAEARQQAASLLRQVRAGLDPLEERTRDEARQAAEAEATKARAVTFKEAAIAFIDAKRAGWSNPKHAAQWAATLEAHAYSVIGAAPVSEIDRERVLSVLRPVWERIPETATRLRGRLENILDFATVNGWREGDNPARWRGNLKQILADRNKMAAVQPRPALPWRLMPQFWAEMDQTSPIAANVLRFQILTAARPSEARSLRWGELDMAGAVWTVPARRMKARVTHWVPLSTSALSILEAMTAHGSRADAYVFPGARDGKPLSDATVGLILERMNHPKLRWIDPKLEGRPVVPHGFRSTFRDWAGEATDTAREIIEMSLAHSVGNKAERAYSRSDQIDKRRALLDAWADFVTSGGATE